VALIWAIPTWTAQRLHIAGLRHKIAKLEKICGKKDKTISSKEAQINMKEEALEELSDEVQKKEQIEVIKDAFLPKK